MDWLAGMKNLDILYVKISALVRLSTEYKLMSCIFLSGMINSGMGPSHVNTFLTACNIPPINHKTIAKKENIIGQIIEEEANKSCARSLEEEIQSSKTLECSYDAGWQTRGTGWNYNSISGKYSSYQSSSDCDQLKLSEMMNIIIFFTNGRR